ncbi:MAG: GNAT family N-acetyltransferase [Myxococcales bacterium]|nr:GNAT family N-acetyltransferase [Myxococcales bacterium]
MDEWVARLQRNRPFVVENDGVIVGFADLQNDGYIDQFYVSATHAKQGVGRHLMKHIMLRASMMDLPSLYSHVSLTAQPFFLRFGFELVNQRTVVVRGVSMQNALMTKTLTNPS